MKIPKIEEYLYEEDLYGGYDYSLDVPAYGYSTKGGWYFEPPLSEHYIDQVTSALANENKVTVERGEHWGLNIKKRKLTYNLQELRHGTKSELMGCLLHEIGHLRHTTHIGKLTSPYLTKYPLGVKEVINVFEDFRVDGLMEKAYPGAEGIYEFNRKAMEAEGQARFNLHNMREMEFEGFIRKLADGTLEHSSIPREKLTAIAKELLKKLDQPSLQEYCGNMCFQGTTLKFSNRPEILKLVKETKHAIELGKRARDTQSLLNMLDKEVFPKIEHLLENFEEAEQLMRGIEQSLKGVLLSMLIDKMGHDSERLGVTGKQSKDKEGGEPTRGHGEGDSIGTIPREVYETYEEIRRAVYEQTKRMARLIARIKKHEESRSVVNRQRSGKVDSRRLFKSKMNEPRIFEKVKQHERRLNSMAFTLIVDRSGSMHGDREVDAAKSTTLLAEVAKLCKIPIEIIAYDGKPHEVKTFKDAQDKKFEQKVLKFILHANGENNIERAIQSSKLTKQDKVHKFMFLITDGGEPSPQNTRKWIGEFMRKHKITPYLICIDGDQYIDPPFGVVVKDYQGTVNAIVTAIKGAVDGTLKFI